MGDSEAFGITDGKSDVVTCNRAERSRMPVREGLLGRVSWKQQHLGCALKDERIW